MFLYFPTKSSLAWRVVVLKYSIWAGEYRSLAWTISRNELSCQWKLARFKSSRFSSCEPRMSTLSLFSKFSHNMSLNTNTDRSPNHPPYFGCTHTPIIFCEVENKKRISFIQQSEIQSTISGSKVWSYPNLYIS